PLGGKDTAQRAALRKQCITSILEVKILGIATAKTIRAFSIDGTVRLSDRTEALTLILFPFFP
ncbi:hypothetical protein PN499_02420, partial [Kamptonema animale CS-326]|uniref:hypothetical protein n=1 Tax=Kamptonema animale TaxID=92934 RepID=UPI00232DF3F2